MPNITRDIVLDAIEIQQKFFDALTRESDKGTFIL
jgi:hypothetical protein